MATWLLASSSSSDDDEDEEDEDDEEAEEDEEENEDEDEDEDDDSTNDLSVLRFLCRRSPMPMVADSALTFFSLSGRV
jgi:hypothetical protein